MAFPYSTEVRSAYLIRLLSLVLSAVTVWLIYFMVREIWPNENMLALATAFFVATIPQFVHISASISNTNLATTLSTAYLLSLNHIYGAYLLGFNVIKIKVRENISFDVRENIKNVTRNLMGLENIR